MAVSDVNPPDIPGRYPVCHVAPSFEVVLATLRDFWAAGVDRVSPGALGMEVWRHSQAARIPFRKSELLEVVTLISGVEWDGDWIVREKVV